jgi:hypothetical protein
VSSIQNHRGGGLFSGAASLFYCAFVAGLALANPAQAAKISNHDETEHKLSIAQGDEIAVKTIKPQQSLDSLCLKACVVRIDDNDEDEYELDADDIVAIEDGVMYYDGPDKPEASAPPDKK